MTDHISLNNPPKIRLATSADRGSAFYNCYHLITQISSLYQSFANFTKGKQEGAIFGACGDAAIKDLGTIYIVWEGVTKDANANQSVEPRLMKRISHSCSQFAKVLELVNHWTSFSKIASLGLLAESRWRKILKVLAADASKEGAVISELVAASDQRSKQILSELEKTKVNVKLTQDAFETAEQSLLDKSFGF